jgi:8-oxo-dGTP pyrophosphatase MutT (NUDIX family)
VVRAAGGVVLRRSPSGTLETVLVHRPAYHDWTFPKDKLLRGETEEEAAVREVEEETGLRCELGREVGTTSYRDQQGRQKTARYWEMTTVEGKLAATNEVDEARWVPVEEAADMLTHGRDRELLGQLDPAGDADLPPSPCEGQGP